MKIRKTYKYRFYTNKRRNKRLHQQINVAGLIWNHALALQKRYYQLTGKYIGLGQMKKHIAKLRMKTEHYGFWRDLGSQAVQDVLERLDKAYERFFDGTGGLPQFKKVKKYKSVTLKQAGWKMLDSDGKRYGYIRLGKLKYKFVQHRPMNGIIKTVTIKRDTVGRLWICFSVMEMFLVSEEVSTGKIGGFDFGLKHFLTNDEGQTIEAPLYYADDLPRLGTIQRQVSKKIKGSNNQRKGKQHLARRHIRIDDKRRDFHYQLAHDLCDIYDVLVFEDLNIDGMKHLWGRKVSDLGFAQFMKIMEWVAFKRGKKVIKIDRWTPTTQICSGCGKRHKLALEDRELTCDCGLVIDRDHNAARNILEAGHRLILPQSIEDLSLDGQSALTSEAQRL